MLAPANTSHAELREFLTELERELDEAVNRHPEWFGDLHDHVRAAWRPVQGHFREARAALDPSSLGLGRLAEHGLAGEELALKLELWTRALRRVRQAREASRPDGGVASRAPRAVLRALRAVQKAVGRLGLGGPAAFAGLLKVANIILGSLGALVPPAGAIKEFKESVEEALGAY